MAKVGVWFLNKLWKNRCRVLYKDSRDKDPYRQNLLWKLEWFQTEKIEVRGRHKDILRRTINEIDNIETATLRHRIALLVKSSEDKKRMTKVLHQLTLMNFGFTVER